jgi:hypothetical protein
MRDRFKSGRPPLATRVVAIANLWVGLAGILLFTSKLSAAENPPTRLVRCGRGEAVTELSLQYQIPGSAQMGAGFFTKPFEAGDERRPAMGPSKAVDAMGTETTTLTEFGAIEVTFTIRQVPGPDRLNPYQVVIHCPFQRNVSGTIDGTKYEVTWNDVALGKDPAPNPGSGGNHANPNLNFQGAPITNSVAISPKELMMFPHDARLAFDVQPDSESGSGDWIRFKAKNPAGGIAQVFRIQVLSDPGGNFGTAEVAESDVRAVCAPYLPNSLEKRCEVQRLKRASGDVYYCLLTNATFANNPEPPAEQFRNLFLGVFRVSDNVAIVVGNLSQRDDVGFRMMMETLGRIYTLPIVGEPKKPVTPEESGKPQ